MSRKTDNSGTGDYTVGFGRPPVTTRFQPGQSGNPKGRTKGAKNFATAIDAELKARVAITENGKPRNLAKLEVIAKRLVNKAAEGDPKAMALLLQFDRASQTASKTDATPLEQFAEVDQPVIDSILQRIRRTAAPIGESEADTSASATGDTP